MVMVLSDHLDTFYRFVILSNSLFLFRFGIYYAICAQLFMCSLYLSCFFSTVSGGVSLCSSYCFEEEHYIVSFSFQWILFCVERFLRILLLYESYSCVVFKPLSCVTGPMIY